MLNLSRISRSFAAFIILCLVAAIGKAQTRSVEELRSAFVDSLLAAKRPGGIFLINDNCDQNKVIAQPMAESHDFDDVLHFLVKTNPSYLVNKQSGVVNFLNIDYEPEILQTRINDFLLDSDVSPSASLNKLLSLPELIQKVRSSGLNQGLQIMVGPSHPHPTGSRRTKHLTFVTLIEVLNGIAKFYGNGIWAYTEDRCSVQPKASLSFVN